MGKFTITRDKFLSTEQARKLLKTCEEMADLDLIKGRRTWPDRFMLVHLAIHSGLRVSELAGLKIKDLHLNHNENYVSVRHGKRDKSRDVYIDKALAKHLKAYTQLKAKTWEESIDPESPLFQGRGANHYTPNALALSFKQALKQAGLPMNYSIHSARHTYATHSLASSNNLRFTQKQLGHENIGHTALYADIQPEKRQELADTFKL